MNRDIAISIGPGLYPDTSSPVAHCRFMSFDNGVTAEGLLQRPDRYRFWTPGIVTGPLIPRGAGLSYAAASFCEGGLSIEQGSFNRVLDFDSEQHIVEVEAGIELSALHDFLSSRGLYLPIQPGHGRITVGGCIASDVHGKNHARDGTFINQVVGLTLFHPEQGLIEVSPETEPVLFRLTCGGYGLTGHILRVRLRASPIPMGNIEVNAMPVGDAMLGVEQLAYMAREADFAYTWHDFTLNGTSFGRGYVFHARFVPAEGESSALANDRDAAPTPQLSAIARASWRLSLLNRWTARAMNFAYRSKQDARGRVRQISLRDALFPIHEAQFYFKLFGARGFHEQQVVIPMDHIGDYLDAVRDYLARRPLAVTLASAKLFRGQSELLRFTEEGVCFALNIPRTSAAPTFLAFLDELVISLGGIPNIIKDSRLPRTVIEACYPGAQRFRDQLRSFDPKRLFRSELSERLGL